MKTALLAALASLLAAPGTAPQGQAAGPWTALPLPSLARPATPSAQLRRLETGRCLLGPRHDPQVLEVPAPAFVEPASLLRLLLDEASARDLDVELHPSAPPLLARGDPADVAVLRGILADLDALGSHLDVTLSVWVVPPGSDSSDPAAFASVSQSEPDFHAVVRSGQRISFGSRTAAAFLTGYDVEVAADSGVADPVLSRAWLGHILHVRPSRVRGGRAVHLECLAESSELEGETPSFDPGTPDLGLLEQPVVRFAQLGFSDVVESGGATSVTVSGSVDRWLDRTVWIRAETTPDPVTTAGGGSRELSWSGLDLALFEYRGVDLPLPRPGAELDELAQPGEGTRVLTEAFPAAQVALAADSGPRRRPGAVWSPGYLLLPSGGPAHAGALEVVAALEQERLDVARLSAAHGTLRIDLPSASGQPMRMLVGRETLRLLDYDSHVAQESWMPIPIVERIFDGLCIQGHLSGGVLRGQAWVSETRATREIERSAVGVGRLQLLERGLQIRAIQLGGGGASVLTLRSTSPGLTLELHSR